MDFADDRLIRKRIKRDPPILLLMCERELFEPIWFV